MIEKKKKVNLSETKALFGSFFVITQFPSLNIFHTICGPHTYHSLQAFFFVPKKKKRRNPEQTEVKERRRRKKKS